LKKQPQVYIVDAHEDLAWNMLTFQRDYTRAADETRRLENGSIAPEVNGHTMLGWPEYRQGNILLVFATLFASPARARRGEWDTQYYRDAREASQLYRNQVDAYHRLNSDHPDKYRIIHTVSDLDELVALREENDQDAPVGLVLLMEGAEGVRKTAELEWWYQKGVRIIGPAWLGTRFCGGTREPGGLTDEGRELLSGMADWNIGLDVSHMDERAVLESLDEYPGPILASHSNARALLKGSRSNRHLSDRVIRGLIARDAVIGIVPYNCFLQEGWRKGDERSRVPLARAADQIDYICQLAGGVRHAGLGSDFDGGFGLSAVPAEMDTIADLQLLVPLLEERGYEPADIQAVMGQNWLRHGQQILP
jgi:membrane dipeptidase